jgi:Lipid A 3-O-deacylase (PagL)
MWKTTLSLGVRAVAYALLCVSTCVAQEAPLGFPDWNWDFGVWVADATGEETRNSFTQVHLWTAGAFAGHAVGGEIGNGWHRGNVEYGIALMPFFLQTKLSTIHGGGFEPVVLRWNSALPLGRAHPYIELAGGGVFTDKNLPPGNTSSFNFTARGGGGINLPIRRKQSLDLRCSWYHISNANLGTWNPEFNGIQVGLAYHWRK